MATKGIYLDITSRSVLCIFSFQTINEMKIGPCLKLGYIYSGMSLSLKEIQRAIKLFLHLFSHSEL